MENSASGAIKDAKRWIATAAYSGESGNYDIALYSAEMALEIAMKALLIKNGVDYPKKHDVIDQFKLVVNSRGVNRQLREKSDDIVKTFSKLLDLRNMAGYNFGELKLDDQTKQETRALIGSTGLYIKIIEATI
jgi:HEPN domain-containing protein